MMNEAQWYVMRDLKRSNAKEPAYLWLREQGFTVFTPMTWKISAVGGKRVRREVPFIQDLLFVRAAREELDPAVDRVGTLQYRWLRNTYREPMTVPADEMERFMRAAAAADTPRYLTPAEITPQMLGRRIRIVGGPFEGQEGSLVTTRGSRTRRLMVQIPNLLALTVQVEPEYIELIK